ncbi:FKBP-type peptidyl-prolyl cis-trans isomerase [Plantactinospora sp. WMMB334]|uniref:FKBP-type peptidyl-prolyl cis-trans isomerase n=1 Tax=Plantactinospora sp. WMMB334 TaxID=3404119 RepID=UPI003B9505E3
MSDPVQSPGQPGPTSPQRPSKQERRAAAAAAAAQAAAARARRQRVTGAVIGVVLAGLGVVALVVLPDVLDEEPTSSAAPAATASPTPGEAPTAAPAPTVAPESPAASRPPADLDPRLAQRPTVEAGSGDLTKLTVTPLIEGTGPVVRAGQQILVNYVGVSYETGQEFDASWNRGQPFQTEIGTGAVIPGWDQGLVGVRAGSRVRLDIPSDLAYGDNPTGGQPGGPLRFVVDVLAVQ